MKHIMERTVISGTPWIQK